MSSELLDSMSGGEPSLTLAARLEVISGLHLGVCVPLERRRYCIGSSLSADIVLHDSGIAPEHAVLQVERRSIRLEAAGGDIGLPTGPLPKGHGSYLPLPTELVLGEATVRLFLPGIDAEARGRFALWRNRTRSGRGIVSAVALCLAGGVAILAMSIGKPDANATEPVRAAELGSVAADNLAKDKITTPPRINDVLRDLTVRIDQAGLHALKAAVTDGRLTVTGALDKPDAETWTTIQRWFDQTYGRQIILSANVNIAEGKTAPLRLQAVRYGANPYVIAADGAHYYEGSTLDSGWVIREIGADRALLVRNGESIALSYR
jgi:hypothetical protein